MSELQSLDAVRARLGTVRKSLREATYIVDHVESTLKSQPVPLTYTLPPGHEMRIRCVNGNLIADIVEIASGEVLVADIQGNPRASFHIKPLQ